MRYLFKLFASLLLVSLVAGCTASETYIAPAAGPDDFNPDQRVFILKNGLTLIIKESKREAPVSVQAWVQAGSVTDPPGRSGLAHLTEHAIFTGSRGYPDGSAGPAVEMLGGRLYGHTGRDFSYFGVTVPSQRWKQAADILYDMVAHPSFNPSQVEKERKVVLLEIATRAEDPDDRLLDTLFQTAFREHPYKNTVAGAPDEVKSISLPDIKDYYAKFYIPARMVVVVTGNVNPREAKLQVEKTFGSIPQAAQPKLKVPQEPLIVIWRQKAEEMPVSLTYLAYGWRVAPASDQDAYALEVLSALLGDGRGSRLYLELRQRRGLANDVRTDFMPLRDEGMLVVFADLTDPDGVGQVTDELLRQINRVKDKGVSQDEVARAVARVEGAQMIANDTAEGQAYSLGYWATVYGGKDPEEYAKRIKKVTPDDVKRVAQKYLAEGSYSLAIIQPEGGKRFQGKGE